MIATMLKLRGIELKGRVKVGPMPRGDVVHVATHFSQPLGEIVSTLNKFSNNFMAGQILKTVGAEMADAPGSWEKGVDVIRRFLVEIGIPNGSFVLGNGSGFNDVNRVTPAQITRILTAMHSRFEVAAGVRRFARGRGQRRGRSSDGSRIHRRSRAFARRRAR